MTADVRWVRIRSWHIVRSEFTSRGGLEMATTACGRRVTGETVDDRPGDEKTCETCFRIAGPK
jgi:hypothetical protein